jgi:hypothetical protein
MMESWKGARIPPEPTRKGSFYCKRVYNTVTGDHYDSLADASRKTNEAYRTIRNHCYGNVIHPRWKFA